MMSDLMHPENLPIDEHNCIAEVDLFRDLSRREMAAIGAHAPMRVLDPGQIVYSPTQPVSVLFIVKRGRIRLFRVTADGRTVTNAVLEPGAVFGEMEPLGLRMRDNWAEALEQSALCLMSRADVRELLFTDPRIALRIAELLSDRVDELEQRLTDVSCKPLDERLSSTLCSLARRRPEEPIRLTHQQLAALVGASRERITTALGELVRRQLVSVRRGKIYVRDFEALRRYPGGVTAQQ
jgi:CRP/FNR family cyclic AMP-dependent transcriptional regulator